jgi:hypothetical protein
MSGIEFGCVTASGLMLILIAYLGNKLLSLKSESFYVIALETMAFLFIHLLILSIPLSLHTVFSISAYLVLQTVAVIFILYLLAGKYKFYKNPSY